MHSTATQPSPRTRKALLDALGQADVSRHAAEGPAGRQPGSLELAMRWLQVAGRLCPGCRLQGSLARARAADPPGL